MAKSADRDFPKNTTEIGAAIWKFLGHKLAIILPSYFVAWAIGFVANQIINKFTAEVVLKNLINSIPAFCSWRCWGYLAIKCCHPLGMSLQC